MTTENPAGSQAEQEYILRAKQEWEQTFDAVQDLVFIVDNDYIIQRANRAMAERCGLKVTEIVGRKCYELIHGTDSVPAYCPHACLMESKKPQSAEFELENLHGFFEVTLSPLVNAEGQIWANVHVARDISGKHKIEQALKESERRFSVFMEHLPLMVVIKNGSGKILFANQYLKDILAVEDLAGKTFEELFQPAAAREMTRTDQEAIAEGLGLYKEIIIDNTGNEIILDTYKFPIPRSDGTTLLGLIGVDVTEKMSREKMLAEQKKQLLEINSTLELRISEAVVELRKKDAMLIQESRLTAMGEMISNIAHQWRQPLNNIGLIVQGLQIAFKADDLSVEELDEDIADTMRTLQQISETIDDFRNFFSHEKEQSSFTVNDLVSRALVFAEPSLRCKGIKIELDEQPGINALGYPNEYVQAFLNIILNARDVLIDQQVKNPVVSIRIFEENGHSTVIVRDNGGGIPEHVLPKIFDPYFTTKQQGKGTGIGLYMAKNIIEKHMGGRLKAGNRDGCAEFSIEL